MQLHLDEIAIKITPGAHAILLLNQAGWHGAKDLKVPSNISLLQVPPRAPELNSQENPGSSCGRTGCQIVSSNPSTTLSIIAARLEQLINWPCKIMSIARRDWAAARHSI
jgi:hypothetical protein